MLRKKQNVQKRRPKKKETTPSQAELDLKLQNLMLDDNLEDNTDHDAGDSFERILEETTSMVDAVLNTEKSSPSHADGIENIGWTPNISNTSSMTSNERVSSTDKSVVIDLLSPTPFKPSNTSKFKSSSEQNIEVINLSDSEKEVSPEHKQKAKELRLFLASIRNEIH